jgi:phage terminase large subunit
MKILKAFEEPFRFTGRYLFLVGGRGSGKTHFAVQKTIVRCLTENNSNHLVVRKTNPALRKSIWKSFFRYLHNNPEIDFEPRYTDQTIIINRNEIVFSGLDDPDKVKSIDGINAGVVMEECSDFTRDDFDALDAILRGKIRTYSQIIGMLNPDRKTTFVYKDFVETEKSDSLVHVSNVYDNLYMPESYRKVLENINDPEKRKSWLLGEWADTGDLVFTHYRIVNDIIVDKAKFTFIAGADWGFVDPSVFLLIGVYDSSVYVIDELYERQMQTTEFCNRINELLAEYGLRGFDAFPDCAEPDRNEILANVTGLNVIDIKKDKLGEIAIVKEHNLFVSSQCVETIKEIQSYSWKKDRDGNTIDKPCDGGDHCMDALEYAVAGYFRNGSQFIVM